MKILLIDGENFRKKIQAVFTVENKKAPEWHEFDFKLLIDTALKGIDIDRSIFYFARLKEHTDTKEKSKQLIEGQRKLKTHLEQQGFEVVLSGRVRGQKEGRFGKLVFKEKGIDVQIAVDMVSGACDGDISTIILGSSDSDLQPAIEEARKRDVECIYLGFEMQPNKGLTYTTNRTILIRNSEIIDSGIIKP